MRVKRAASNAQAKARKPAVKPEDDDPVDTEVRSTRSGVPIGKKRTRADLKEEEEKSEQLKAETSSAASKRAGGKKANGNKRTKTRKEPEESESDKAEEKESDDETTKVENQKIPDSLMITRLSGDEMSLIDTLEECDKGAILFFYPKASTPGCTKQGQNFNAALSDFTSAGITIFGISRDKVPAQTKFKEKQSFEFELLSDAKGDVSGFFKIKKGATSVLRSVYVLSKDGTVIGGGQASPAESVSFAKEILKDNKMD